MENNSQYDEKVKKIKNNKLVVWALLLFGIVIGISQFLDSGKNIFDKVSKIAGVETKDSVLNIEQKVDSKPQVVILPQPETINNDVILPAKMKIVQFALNSDSCFFTSNNAKDESLIIQPISDIETTIENIEGQIAENDGKETAKINRKKYSPLLDITVFNEGEEKAVLTSILVSVKEIAVPQGSGAIGTGSHAIQSSGKYYITLPDFLELYPNLSGHMTKINFVKEYPAIPPILIDGNDAARFQLVMGNKMITGATYKIVFDFIFSNGQKLSKKILIDF